MKRKTIITLCFVLAAALLLGACSDKGELNLPEEHDAADLPEVASPAPQPNNAATIVVMTVEGREITKDIYDQTYSAICQQFGVSEDDEAYKSIIHETVVDYLLAEQAVSIKLEELGYLDLSEEDLAYAQQQAQGELDYLVLNNLQEVTADLPEDYTDEQYDAAVKVYEDSLFEQYNITREDHLNYFKEAIALENAKAELLSDVAPTEAEVLLKFQEGVQADKEAIGDDLSVYEIYLMQNTPSFYVPEGIRMVRHVLISLDSELSSNIISLRSSDGDDAANEARDEALKTIQEKADDILAQIQNEEITFTEAIELYGEDPGMSTNTDGYEVFEGCSMWMPEFTEGAMSLSEVGEITGLVATDYGYHIMEYTSDKASGPVDLELAEQEIYDGLLSEKQDEAYAQLLEQWKSEIEYTVYDDVL